MLPVHPSRLRTAVFSGIRSPLRWTVLLLAVYVAANAAAQGTLPLTAVVTDQTPLDLSDRFGIPAASGVDQLGNFAFIGRGNSALFLRRTGSATIERLLQAGDEVPGFPGSSVLDFSLPVQELAVPGAAPMMAAGRMAFIVEFSTGDGFTHQAILLYEDGGDSTLAHSDGIASGSGGHPYGWLALQGLNERGDVAFTATLSSTDSTALETLYLVPFGAPAARIVGPSDALPTPPGGFAPPPSSSILFLALNNLGEVAFEMGTAIFRASTGGIQAIGNRTPLGASFSDTGTLAFLDQVSGLQTANAAGSVITVVPFGSAAPSSIGGTLSPIFFEPAQSPAQFLTRIPPVINSADEILFAASVSNSLVTSLALLRRRNDATLEVVAYAGQSAPGAGASTFASFGSVSLAPDGKATFVASFAGGGQGLYEQTGTSAPIALAIDGQAAPVFGGGIFALFDTTVARVLDDGSTCFGAVISGGAALYAEFWRKPRQSDGHLRYGPIAPGRSGGATGRGTASGTQPVCSLCSPAKWRWGQPVRQERLFQHHDETGCRR